MTGLLLAFIVVLLLRLFYVTEIGGVQVAESPEVAAFRESVQAGLDNIAADIQRLLTASTGLSEEDKATLSAIADKVASIAAVVPE